MLTKNLGVMLLVVVTSTIGISLLVPKEATAQPYQSSGITVRPIPPAPGAITTVIASGFRPATMVTVIISSFACRPTSCAASRSFDRLGRAHADANGVATERVVIPHSFASGSIHVIEAQGLQVNGRLLTETTNVKLSKPTSRRVRAPRHTTRSV
jgi:hypothetical protein